MEGGGWTPSDPIGLHRPHRAALSTLNQSSIYSQEAYNCSLSSFHRHPTPIPSHLIPIPAKHPAMKNWPADHSWFVGKLDITQLWEVGYSVGYSVGCFKTEFVFVLVMVPHLTSPHLASPRLTSPLDQHVRWCEPHHPGAVLRGHRRQLSSPVHTAESRGIIPRSSRERRPLVPRPSFGPSDRRSRPPRTLGGLKQRVLGLSEALVGSWHTPISPKRGLQCEWRICEWFNDLVKQ